MYDLIMPNRYFRDQQLPISLLIVLTDREKESSLVLYQIQSKLHKTKNAAALENIPVDI